MIFRIANASDISDMVRIEKESFGSRAFNKRQFQYYVKNHMAYVVSSNDTPMGYIVVFVRRNSGEAYINVIAIDPVFTGRGWGTFLLHETEQLYHNMAYNRMALHVDAANTRAIDLYKLREYELVQIIPDYYGEGTTGIKMIKNLR